MSTREVVATGYGGPEVLEVREVELPAPGDGEVLVEVRAIGVNAWDVKSYSPAFNSTAVGDDPAKRLPVHLGSEAAGVTSDGVEVVCYPVSRAYADRLVAKAENVLPKPASVSFEQAAGLVLTGVAAAHLVAATAVADGEVVLLHGAAGGVGLIAAQLALHRGARVIGSALPQDHDLLRELGVEPFAISYDMSREDLRTSIDALAPEGVDAVLDAVGTEPVLDVSVAVVHDRHRVATLVPSPAALAHGVQQLGFGAGADPGDELRRAARADLLQAVDEGWLRVVVAATYPLAEVAQAHRDMVGPHGAGKLILVP